MERHYAEFRHIIWEHYCALGRGELPWRPPSLALRDGKAAHPYYVLVSEFMLQQTQSARVAPKYKDFLQRFPTVAALAAAAPRDVIEAWQGLGYNRRARALHLTAQHIMARHHGRVPHDITELLALPGIGPYTAGAIKAFAFNEPVIFIETNIRRAYLDFFFQDKNGVRDADILPYIEATLDTENPREWYYALMDYGASLGKTFSNANRRSAHYSKQSKFEGSDRQVRARIVRTLLVGARTEHSLIKELNEPSERIARAVSSLMKDGMVVRHGRSLRIV